MNKSATGLERIVFVTRQSAIGDVIIAMRAITLLRRNNYFPVFVTSRSLKDVPLRTVELSAFICVDKNQNPLFFLERKEVKREIFYQFLRDLQVKRNPLFLDLQKTSRSKRTYSFLKNDLKIVFDKIYSVRKRTLFRLFLIFLAWFRFSQKKRSRTNTIFRIHELQELKIREIVSKDSLQYVPLLKDFSILLADHQRFRFIYEKYVCIFPGASAFIKAWPKENIRNLISDILLQTKAQILVCGASQGEEFLGEYLSFPKNDRVVNLVNKTTLDETLTLISRAQYVVTNDSFAAHAADAFCVPASVIFGATSPRFGFVPLSEKISFEYENLSCSPCTRHGKSKCRYENLKCLKELSHHKVLQKMLKQL